MPWCEYVEHGLEYIMFYVQKHIAPFAVCSGPQLVRDGPPAFVRLAYYNHLISTMGFPILGLYSLRRRRLIGIEIPIINLRRSDDRLRFIMGIPILIRRRLLSE